MDAGVDDEANRAEKFGLQPAEIAEGIAVVPAGLLREPFRIKRPAFLIRRERNQLPELRQPFQFLRGRNLPMMAGHAFVIRERAHAPLRDFVHVAQVCVENSGPRPVERRSIIISAR